MLAKVNAIRIRIEISKITKSTASFVFVSNSKRRDLGKLATAKATTSSSSSYVPILSRKIYRLFDSGPEISWIALQNQFTTFKIVSSKQNFTVQLETSERIRGQSAYFDVMLNTIIAEKGTIRTELSHHFSDFQIRVMGER